MSLNLYWKIAAAALGVLALSGCDSGDDGSGGGLTEDPTSDSDQSAGSTGLGTSGGPPSTTTEDYGSAETESDVSGAGTTGDDPEINGCPCEQDIDCGFGLCVESCDDASEDPMFCFCQEQVLELGGEYDCLRCEPLLGDLDIDLTVQSVTGRILFNENMEPPPIDQASSGELFLYNPETGDKVFQASTNELAFNTKAISGIYDVAYSVVANSAGELPWNKHAVLERVGVTTLVGLTDEHSVTVKSTRLDGKIRVNTGAPEPVLPGDESDDGKLYLRNHDTGDEVYLGKTSETPYASLHVLAGEYDLVYELESPGAMMPRNHRAVLPNKVVVEATNSTGEALDLSIPVVIATGSFTLNGEPTLDDEDNRGLVMLRDPVTEDVIELGETSEGGYSLPIVPGTYEVLYTGITSSGPAPMPMNAGAVLETITISFDDPNNDINIQAVSIGGDVTIDDVAPPDHAGDDGELWLEAAGEGYEDLGRVRLGNTTEGSYATTVIEGTYDLYYSQETASDLVPVNTHARLADDVTLPGGVSAIPIDTVLVEGSYKINGVSPALSGFEDARVFLKNTDTGDSALLGYLSEGSFSRRVIKGDYTVYYALESGGDALPVNVNGRIDKTLELYGEDESGHEIDIPVVNVKGSFTYNEDAPPTEASDYGLFYLVDRMTGDEIYLGSSREQTFAEHVLPGDYLVYYRHGYTGSEDSESPRNSNALIRCVTISAP